MKNEIEFPECWEEIRPKEWIYLLELYFKLMKKSDKLKLVDLKNEWCRFVLSTRGIKRSSKMEYYLLIFQLSSSLDWMFKIEGNTIALDFNSTENLLPYWKKYRGPLSHGSDLAFGEFRAAVVLYNSYNKDHNEFFLDALCGMLYRKPGKYPEDSSKFNGEYRVPFSPNRIELYASYGKKFPEHIKWGIYAWFSSFCQYLVTGLFIIEGNELCFSSIFNKNQENEDSKDEVGIGMSSILFSVSESGVFGNINDTDNALLLRVMLKLLNDKITSDELLKSYKK